MKTFADFGIDTKGRNSGEIKTICPQCSHVRKKKAYPCLNVNLDKNVWHCWHCDWSGGLKDGPKIAPVITRTYRKPEYVRNATGLPDGVVQWFEKRGITQAVLTRNNIGHGSAYFPQVEEERTCVMFPYYRGTEVINVKYRTADKLFRMAGGAERALYGLNDIDTRLVWVEGEIDKLSVEISGVMSCVSVPDGAPAETTKNYSNKFEFLEAEELNRATTHVIAVDSDGPGRRLEEELIRRLGRENCLIVRWPDGCKDANDVLKAYGAEVLRGHIDAAQPLPIEGAHPASEFLEQLDDYYANGMPKAFSTGWKTVDGYYSVLPGEWTLITGIPGDGKSEWLDAMSMNLARNEGWVFGVFSPENLPVAYHLQKLAEKYIGKPFANGPTERMTASEKDVAASFIDQHYVFMLPESPTLEALLEIAKQLVRRRGIRGLIIDPWNEVDHSRTAQLSETEYISLALGKIRAFARNHGVHVWIVAHPTKLFKRDDGNYPCPTPYDVSGSAHWRNKADNCVAVWRDRINPSQDVEIHVQKVRKRFVGAPGCAILKWDSVTGCYHSPLYPRAERIRNSRHKAAQTQMSE